MLALSRCRTYSTSSLTNGWVFLTFFILLSYQRLVYGVVNTHVERDISIVIRGRFTSSSLTLKPKTWRDIIQSSTVSAWEIKNKNNDKYSLPTWGSCLCPQEKQVKTETSDMLTCHNTITCFTSFKFF